MFLELTLVGCWNVWLKIIFLLQYLFIAISCAKILCVTWALKDKPNGQKSEAVFLVVYDPSVNELWVTNLAPVNELWNTEILEFLVRGDSQIFDLWTNFVGLTFKRKSRSQLVHKYLLIMIGL